MLFAGLSLLAWRTRDLQRSAAIKAVFQAFALAMAGLAVVGGVGLGILLAIIAEVFFAVAFFRLATAQS